MPNSTSLFAECVTMASAVRLVLHPTRACSHPHLSQALSPFLACVTDKKTPLSSITKIVSHRSLGAVPKASPESGSIVPDEEEGVSLGTMKLPSDTDIPRFESLLFQWANSLCQGANLPLPVPLKVDKIAGGVRLGFITIGDGKTEVLVYIDCLVFPAADGSPPTFRAIRNGPLKDISPPGEPRIMRSLLQALKKSVEIAIV